MHRAAIESSSCRVSASLACLACLIGAAACGDDGGGTGGASHSSSSDAATSSALATSSSGAGGSASSPAATIASDDGSAVLILEEGALPAGVAVDDIVVTALEQEDVFEGLDEGWGFVAAYELQPEGLVFEIPARLAVTAEVPSGVAIISALISSETADVLETEIERSPGPNGASGYSLVIPHFSHAITVSGPDVGAASVQSGLTDTVPKGPTTMAARVTPILFGEVAPQLRFTQGDRSYRVRLDWLVTTWTLEGLFLTQVEDPDAPEGNLVPVNPDAPAAPTDFDTVELDLFERFRCDEPRPMFASYYGYISFLGVATWIPDDGGAEEREEVRIVGNVKSSESRADCVSLRADGIGDFIDSVASQDPTFESAAIDIAAHHGGATTLTEEAAASLYEGPGAAFPCGLAESDAMVVCADDVLPMPAGDVLAFTSTLAGPVPLSDEDHSYIYALVLDSDGDPANDWVYVPPFDWDLFQGADRWYQLIWDHEAGSWSVTASQVAADQSVAPIPTTARAIVQGDAVTWHVSASELAAAAPTYRTTAFGHDGDFSASDRGADVSGADPTEPLAELDGS